MGHRDIEVRRAYGREYQRKVTSTPEGRLEHRAYLRAWSRQWKLNAMAALGGKCVRCGFDDPRALQFDHVNGDGHKDVKKSDAAGRRQRKSHSLGTYYKRIAENAEPGRFQLLCANCNWIKRDENGEHLTRLIGVV